MNVDFGKNSPKIDFFDHFWAKSQAFIATCMLQSTLIVGFQNLQKKLETTPAALACQKKKKI